MARVAIVGAGIIGVASAYLLCKAGHDVTLIDQNSAPAQGASRTNGAQLSYAYCDALAAPSMFANLPNILFMRDPAFRVYLRGDPEYLIWCFRFLGNCLPGRFVANTRLLLEMADRSSQLLADLLNDFDLSFDFRVAGKMILYPTVAACEKTLPARRLKQSLGLGQAVLGRAESTALEPALDLYPDQIARVVYSDKDAVGRPDVFAASLVSALRGRYGLKTVFGQAVRGIVTVKGRVHGVRFAAREPLECDCVVAAAGCVSDFLPRRDRPLGGVWPVQGYSITARATPVAMRVSITDLKRRIVFARIGDSIRAAGLADIGARRFQFEDDRFAAFKAASIAAFGQAFEHGDGADLAPWSQARPCTPSSRPIIRPGSLKGLYLNMAPGTLGWTLCLGSASRLLEVMSRDA